MTEMPILVRAETPLPPVHTICLILWLLSPFLFLELDMAYHVMVCHLSLAQRRHALFSNHLVSCRTVPQIPWVTLVTCSCHGDWGVVQWYLPLLGGLPFHYLHPGSQLSFVWPFLVLMGSCAMLLFTAQAFSILVLARLLMFFIGKMNSSIVICFVQKSRTIPNSFMVWQPRMRSYTGLVIFLLSYSTMLGVTVYSRLFEYSKNFKVTLLLPLVRKLPFDVCHKSDTCLVK